MLDRQRVVPPLNSRGKEPIRRSHQALPYLGCGRTRLGEFRDRQNMIGRHGQSPREARFVPPPVDEMRVCLDALEKYIGKPSKLLPLIDLALIHHQFETIHPFLDGNGRLGRLLISLLLCERRCLPQPLLDLSRISSETKTHTWILY